MWCCAVVVASLVPCFAAGADPHASIASDAPVRIERCVVLGRSELRDPFNGLRAEYVSGLAIRFVNVRATTATLVRFTVRYQGASQTIVAHGLFASNMSIDRSFASFSGTLGGGDAADCDVLSVTYSDGTAWTGEN